MDCGGRLAKIPSLISVFNGTGGTAYPVSKKLITLTGLAGVAFQLFNSASLYTERPPVSRINSVVDVARCISSKMPIVVMACDGLRVEELL